jgi:hypothetical protein
MRGVDWINLAQDKIAAVGPYERRNDPSGCSRDNLGTISLSTMTTP